MPGLMFDAGGAGTNVIHQAPHNSVRSAAMGNANRAPTTEELAKMESLVDRAMKDGCWGLATGLIYAPGSYQFALQAFLGNTLANEVSITVQVPEPGTLALIGIALGVLALILRRKF